MSLLSIAQAVCASVPEAAPSSIVGNTTDTTAVTLLALANLAGNAVAKRAPWVNMNREYDFQTNSYGPISGVVTTVGGKAVVTTPPAGLGILPTAWVVSGTHLLTNSVITDIDIDGLNVDYTLNLPPTQNGAGSFYFSQSDYALPSDFQRAIDGTFWDRTRYWQMRGSMSPQEWQGFRSSLFGMATIERRWRFRNSDWLSTASGSPATNVLSIDPVPLDPQAQLVFEYVSNGWCANVSSGARQSEWLADTDYGVVDEYLIQLNLTWRLLRRRGVSYSEELDEYEREVDKAVGRDGSTAVLDVVANRGVGLLSPFGIQDGNFPGRS